MRIFKRAGAGLLAILFVATFFVSLAPPGLASAQNLAPTLNTSTNHETEEDTNRLSRELCIFPYLGKDPGNKSTYHIQDGWLKVRIINRAVMQVTFSSNNKNCLPPNTDRKIQFIDNQTETKPFIDGFYYDDDTSGDDWHYRRQAGDKGKEDSIIDEFYKDPISNGDFDAQNKILSAAEIRNFLSKKNGYGAEFTIGIEETSLPNVECQEGSNDGGDNFVLSDTINDNEDFRWECTGSGIRDGRKGYRLTKNNTDDGVSTSFEGTLEAFNITYNYNGTEISHVSSGHPVSRFIKCADGKFYEQCAGSGKYLDITEGELNALIGKDVRTVNSAYGDVATKVIMKDRGDPSKSEEVVIAGVNSNSLPASTAAAQQAETGNQPDTNNPNASDLECDFNNALTWLICPIIEAANQLVDQLDNAIVRELNIEEDLYFNENDTSSNGPKFYAIWSNFRNIGLVVLVLGALVMVFSQAVSVGPFDAYTVKKVLPRILVAVIFMTLSWDIMKFLIALTNDVSLALRSVIQAPFGSIGAASIGGEVSGALGILGGIGLFALGVVGALSFALTGLMAVLVAFTILTLRKMAIVFLVLIAPFAIACYILPNTQKVYKFWWDTFSKALIMFPIIMGFIAIGRVFAAVTYNTDPTDLLSQIIVLVAYFGPYFAFPLAFRLAGGAIATIAGMANDRTRGAFDRLKNFRKNRSADRIKKFRSGGLYADHTKRGRFGNALGSWVFNPDEKVPHVLGSKGVPGFKGAHTRLAAEINHEKEKQTKETAQLMNEVGANDQTGRVLSGAIGSLSNPIKAELMDKFAMKDKKGNFVLDSNGNKIMRELKTEKDFDDAAAIMAKSDLEAERHASGALLGLKGHLLNLKRHGKGYASVTGAGGLIVASHGFMTEDDLVTTATRIEMEGGSNFADTMMTQMEVNGKNSGLKVTYSHSRDQDGRIISGTKAGRDWDRALSKTYQEIAAQKSHAVQSDVNALSEIIAFSQAPASDQQLRIQRWQEEGMSKTMAERRAQDINDKASAAVKTLQMIDAYNPGSVDSGIIARRAMEKWGIGPLGTTTNPDVIGGTTPGKGQPPLAPPPKDNNPPFTPTTLKQ